MPAQSQVISQAPANHPSPSNSWTQVWWKGLSAGEPTEWTSEQGRKS